MIHEATDVQELRPAASKVDLYGQLALSPSQLADSFEHAGSRQILLRQNWNSRVSSPSICGPHSLENYRKKVWTPAGVCAWVFSPQRGWVMLLATASGSSRPVTGCAPDPCLGCAGGAPSRSSQAVAGQPRECAGWAGNTFQAAARIWDDSRPQGALEAALKSQLSFWHLMKENACIS